MYPKKRRSSTRYLKTIRWQVFIALFVGFIGGYQVHEHTSPPPAVQVAEGNTEVRFSPKGGCTTLLIQAMKLAQASLDIAIFDITSTKIADTLVQLHQKGIQIRVVVDKRQSKGQYSLAGKLQKAGIPIRIGKCSGVMHDKFVVIDGGRSGVVTGSFNYTHGAENKNVENILWIRSDSLAKLYSGEHQRIWGRATPYS